MQMTDGEILRSWNNAEDQKAQVAILADLNAVSVSAMREKLLELGAENVPAGRKKANCPHAKLDELRAMELYNEGMNDLEIAECLGVALSTVTRWRGMMRLKAHRKRAVKKSGQDRTGQDRRAAAGGEEVPVGKEHMDVEGLLRVTQRMQEAFPQAVVLAGGKLVRDVRVHIAYNAAGEAGSVEMELILEDV